MLLIVKAPRGAADIVNVLFGNILTVPVPLLWTMLVSAGRRGIVCRGRLRV